MWFQRGEILKYPLKNFKWNDKRRGTLSISHYTVAIFLSIYFNRELLSNNCTARGCKHEVTDQNQLQYIYISQTFTKMNEIPYRKQLISFTTIEWRVSNKPKQKWTRFHWNLQEYVSFRQKSFQINYFLSENYLN